MHPTLAVSRPFIGSSKNINLCLSGDDARFWMGNEKRSTIMVTYSSVN